MDLTCLLNVLEVGLKELIQARVRLSTFLHKGQFVASAESVLQEEGAAQALQSSLAHDADSVTKHVCFVHVMGRQYDDSVFSVALEHVPEVSSGTQVHTRGRLVEHHKL